MGIKDVILDFSVNLLIDLYLGLSTYAIILWKVFYYFSLTSLGYWVHVFPVI